MLSEGEAMKDEELGVAPATSGETKVNTIAVLHSDVVVPLEMDLDGDPLQDDEVRIRTIDGSFERVLRANGPGVERDQAAGLFRYHFADLRYGAYRLGVRVGDRWGDVGDLVVRAGATTISGTQLSTQPQPIQLPPAVEPPEQPEPPASTSPWPPDQSPAYRG